VFVEPGGGPSLVAGDHVHPGAEKRFRVEQGVIRVRLDGVAHSHVNVSPRATAHVVGSFRPERGAQVTGR